MSEFDHIVTKERPVTPVRASWFEFLLDQTSLERHLSQDNPDPSATDLICQFLHHAAAREQTEVNNSAQADVQSQEEDLKIEPLRLRPSENKKVKALKLLALRTAAFMKWDLNKLDTDLPPVMTYNVLVELIRCAQNNFTADPVSYLDQSVEGAPDHVMFAIQLYHRWCTRVVIKDSFPAKPTKNSAIVVPGLTEITVSPAANEAVHKLAKEQVCESVKVLEKCLSESRDITVPCVNSIGSLSEDSPNLTHAWDQGYNMTAEEFTCQLSYDLGCWYFFIGKYEGALQMFAGTKELMSKIGQSAYVQVDPARLNGYVHACRSLKGLLMESEMTSLLERAEATKPRKFQGLVCILMEDNARLELAMTYRQSLLDAVGRKLGRRGDLYFEVSTCNMVRSVMEGRAVLTNYTAEMADAGKDKVQKLIKISEAAMRTGSYTRCLNLKCFLRYLCEVIPTETGYIESLMSGSMKEFFTAEELEDLNFALQDLSAAADVYAYDEESTIFSEFGPDSELEKQLLISFDPTKIRDVIRRLSRSMPGPQIANLCDKWLVPREINVGLSSLPVQTIDPIFAYILIGKAKHCSELKLFDRSRLLLAAADVTIKDISFKISKLIRCEALLVDLQDYLNTGHLADGATLQDLTKRCKICITNLRLDSDVHPGNEVIAHCAAFLLNIQDWDYLCNLANTNNGFMELARLLAEFSRDVITGSANVRQSARSLWEPVVRMFASNQRAPYRGQPEALLSRLALTNFIRRLKEPTVLSALISCLAKLLTLLKDNVITEICSDHSGLWPSALHAVADLSAEAVADTMADLIKHALYTHPQNHSWLRTQADIYFANNQYSSALKYYLEAGVVSSDFFTIPVPNNVYGDQIYKKMIRCCSYLQCYTQVAILCQFLAEVDYVTAFKSLQERVCYDAMDTYYDCIWDVTILEFLINLHQKRGEAEKKRKAVSAIGSLELNSNNPESVKLDAALLRKQRFLRAMAKQYL